MFIIVNYLFNREGFGQFVLYFESTQFGNDKLSCTKLKLMATQCTYLDYVFTKTSHMNHRPSKALVDTRTDCSPPVSHSRYQPDHTIIHVPEYSLRTSAHYHIHMCLPIHTSSRIIITHSCNKTTNM